MDLRVDMACGTHWVIFGGLAVPDTLADLCAGNLMTLQFVGTESVDYMPLSATHATWDLQGRGDGIFLVTSRDGAGGARRVGTIAVRGCDQFGSVGPIVLAQATAAGSLPDVFSCHALLDVTPQDIFSFPGGFQFEGVASGAGTCQSTDGAWDAQLNGTWSIGGGQPCPGSGYGFSLQLTGSSGTRTLSQGWSPLSQDRQTMAVYSTFTPSGGGRIVEAPEPCVSSYSLPPPFQATADWVFFVE